MRVSFEGAELADTFQMVAAAAADADDRWWIIGSAAVVLHAVELGDVRDVDLLMSARDAESFLRRVGVEPGRGTGDGRFRSRVFGTWREPPLPVEAFGGFEVATDGAWREVTLATREAVTIGDGRLYVPSRVELVRLLHSFGRPKDLERASMLDGAAS